VPGSVEARRPAADAGGWLRTGDLGWLDPDGFLYLTARTDDVTNRGGEKIFPRCPPHDLDRSLAVASSKRCRYGQAIVGS
jgi:long-subunit acyl-CoA synthetase (AMP-forming)